jgi:hypothetical protein
MITASADLYSAIYVAISCATAGRSDLGSQCREAMGAVRLDLKTLTSMLRFKHRSSWRNLRIREACRKRDAGTAQTVDILPPFFYGSNFKQCRDKKMLSVHWARSSGVTDFSQSTYEASRFSTPRFRNPVAGLRSYPVASWGLARLPQTKRTLSIAYNCCTTWTFSKFFGERVANGFDDDPTELLIPYPPRTAATAEARGSRSRLARPGPRGDPAAATRGGRVPNRPVSARPCPLHFRYGMVSDWRERLKAPGHPTAP